VDFSDEGVFEIGMERAGDDREHDGSSVAQIERRNKNVEVGGNGGEGGGG
jgi:hypothetical protein